MRILLHKSEFLQSGGDFFRGIYFPPGISRISEKSARKIIGGFSTFLNLIISNCF